MALDTGADMLNRVGIDDDAFSDYNLVVAYVHVVAAVDAPPGAD